MEYDPEGSYPDRNSSIIVYQKKTGAFVEVEMQSDLRDIAGSDSISWTTWISRTKSGDMPVDVNKAGLITKRLTRNGTQFTGTYGVFHAGTVNLVFTPSGDVAKTWNVTPLTTFEVDETVEVPAGATAASLVLVDNASQPVDTLDRLAIEATGTQERLRRAASPGSWSFDGGYVQVAAQSTPCTVVLYAMNGRQAARFDGLSGRVHSLPVNELPEGTYSVVIKSGSRLSSGRIAILR
jgi:hypothetical protein